MVRPFPRDEFPRQPSFQQPCFPPTSRHASFSGERYVGDAVPRADSFPQDRYGVDPGDGRFQEAYDLHRRHPPMKIDEALRSHCGIAGKQYFVAVISEDGKPMTFFSPSQKLNDMTIRQFFDTSKFQHVMARVEAGADPILDDGLQFEDGSFSRSSSFGRIRASDRRRSSVYDDWEGPPRPGRKRPRPRHPINEEDDMPVTVSSRKGIKIGDGDGVWSFYEQRFKNCQQTACKLIAKAWVKAVEPKKQSTHPYTGSDEKAPDWWPKPWGPTKDDKVRHKEPDHLYKRERVHLLAHILRLVVEPNSKQHNDIQKLGLNVKKLEETTYEALSSFFMDNDTNAKKRPYLNEIFKMARQEERFKNGEIDGSTEVYVMAEDKLPENYASDNEDAVFPKDEEDHELQRPKVNTQPHCIVHTPTTGPGSAQPLHGGHGPFIGELPVRGSSFNPSMLPADMASSQPHTFVDSSGITVTDQTSVTASGGSLALDMVASPHDSSRRPSVFSEYTSPGGSSLYAQQWQQPGSNGPGQASMYAYTPAQGNPQQTSFIGQGVPMNANTAFMGGTFEGSPRSEYDANGPPIFRTGDMPHTPVNQSQGYYVPNDGRSGLRVITQVVDGVPRAQLQ
ncbi:Ydr124wp-like protein [Metarhizium album ARSEF 1941]|uniref:Ydr124wp-like protein n=1 Tax=Metarhizium album (strain ARSEF 1941) TaxID=1081103 RepID=A0A0B2WWS0_METAS|nr:Ydr124wp-like protein [Metarhizium album ARSEF 1941]KHO00667.1 Ydr124wp-like protein [Metarhizium album ARSEF 1941]